MHVPVLAQEVMDYLQVKKRGVYVDCTAGAGGHSALIAGQLTDGRLIAFDRDPQAVIMAQKKLAPYSCATVFHRNYGEIIQVLQSIEVTQVDGILLTQACPACNWMTPCRQPVKSGICT